MLRIIFTGLATCVLLLAAGVRFAREDAPRNVREELASALERSVEQAKQALRWPAAQTALEPTPQNAKPVLSAPARPVPPPPVSKPMPPPAPAAEWTPGPEGEAETVTEESISPLWSAPFVESPQAGLEDAGEGDPEQQGTHALATRGVEEGGLAAAAPSQDEWAGLIRRMLAIYRQVGVAE